MQNVKDVKAYHIAMHSPMKDWKKGDYPVSPFVHIVSRDSSGQLSAQLMSDGEIDDAVNRLIRELEEFREVAKRELKELRSRMHQK